MNKTSITLEPIEEPHCQPADLTTLTLDGTYHPVGFFSARASIKHLITNRAKAYDRYGNLQGWDRWISDDSFHHDNNPYLNSAHRRVNVPTIMVITNFFGHYKNKNVGVSRGCSLKHIYKVYKGVCQYCLKHTPYEQATKDHVYPKSKGGPNEASNLVLSCKKCNSIKKDLFPFLNRNGEEVKPKVLLPFHHHRLYGPKTIREEWKFFLHLTDDRMK